MGGAQSGCQEQGPLWCCAPGPPDSEGEVRTTETRETYPDQSATETQQGSQNKGGGGSSNRSRTQAKEAEESNGLSGVQATSGAASTADNTGKVSFDLVLSDLESAEQLGYGTAFAKFGANAGGFLPLDCAAMRNFIIKQTVIGEDDIDIELLRTASLEDGLSLANFLQILRENAIAEAAGIEEFVRMNSDGMTVPSQDCRSHLLLFAQRRLDANFDDDQWDRIFNVVLMDADITVTMEQWITFCKHIARIVRLFKLCGD